MMTIFTKKAVNNKLTILKDSNMLIFFLAKWNDVCLKKKNDTARRAVSFQNNQQIRLKTS